MNIQHSHIFSFAFRFIDAVPFVKMEQGKTCPSGTEVTTKEECDDALKLASQLGIQLKSRKTLVVGGWSFVPSQCSYQAGGDNAFHFNTVKTENVPHLVNGMYKLICKKGNG